MTVNYPIEGYFRMLDVLKESGADIESVLLDEPSWLEEEFQLPPEKAKEIFELWSNDTERHK